MSSKRHQRRKQCTGKIRYPDSASAHKARIQSARKYGSVFDVYKCEFCKGYHIGHRRRSAWKATRF